jgi:hypothetical protein
VIPCRLPYGLAKEATRPPLGDALGVFLPTVHRALAMDDDNDAEGAAASEHETLKYHLLGPSSTKAGLTFDQSKVTNLDPAAPDLDLTTSAGL